MKIVTYKPQYKERFIELSRLWIEKYFSLEAEDEATLTQVDELIKKGAMIYFAIEENQVIAACMIKPLGKKVWEVGKLATDERYQSKGAGSQVFSACLEYARRNHAEKIILFSNTVLEPAIHLYEKFGFQSIQVTESEYARCNYQAELILSEHDLKSE